MIRNTKRPFSPRAARVTLPDCVFATLHLENKRQIAAKLRRVSLTGGLLDLAVFMEERVAVGLTFPIGSGVVHARAELLFPLRAPTGYLQPFRFTEIRDEQRHILDREISALLKQAQSSPARRELGVSPPPGSFLDLL